MDQQQSNLISLASQRSNPEKSQPIAQRKSQQKTESPASQNLNNQQKQGPIDIITELTQKSNPLPLLAVLDQVDLYTRTKDGVPIFNLLMNKFLPIPDLFQNSRIKFEADLDGRTPLHYAIEVDDAKTVQWLLSKGAHNVADKFGNTPVMDAVRLGHRRSFLLCLHYQHINEELPHIAAEFNRVWELRAMLALGLKLEDRNNKGKTPLEIAVQNYSYQAAEYLATVTTNYNIKNLSTRTDSHAIIKRVNRGFQKSSFTHRALYPLLTKHLEILLVLLTVNYSLPFTTINTYITRLIASLLILRIIMSILSSCKKPKHRSPQSIPRLLHEPYFPNNLDHICPSCFQRYHPQREDHCDTCHICVPKFHQHHYICVNGSNQFLWYIGEFLFGYVLWTVVGVAMEFYRDQKQTSLFFVEYVLTISKIAIQQNNPILATSILTLTILLIKQTLFCLQLIGMAFMNRTYQQVTHSQDYPHLYQVFRNKAGKLKTKEIRIFLRYKLCGGVVVGIRNILLYFW